MEVSGPIWHSPAVTDIPQAKLIAITARFIEVRKDLEEGTPGDIASKIQRALDLDADLVNWKASLPSSWAFESVKSDSINAMMNFGDENIHVYPSIWIAKSWNFYRTVRIILGNLLLQQIAMTSWVPIHEVDQQQCVRTLNRLSEDICSTVPYTTQYFENNGPLAVPKASPMFSLLWPFVVAASLRGTSKARHDFLAAFLHRIGQNVNIPIAEMMAQEMRDERGLDEPLDLELEEGYERTEWDNLPLLERVSEGADRRIQ